MKIRKLTTRIFAAAFMLLMFAFQAPTSLAFDTANANIILHREGKELISPVIRTEKPFNSLHIKLSDDVHELEVNYGRGWEEVDVHDDGHGPQFILFTEPTSTVQFRTGHSRENFRGFSSHSHGHNYIFNEREAYAGDTLEIATEIIYKQELTEEQMVEERLENLYAGTLVAQKDISIISRSKWGADESLRYWTPELEQYYKDREPAVNPCEGIYEKYQSEIGLKRVVSKSPGGEDLIWPLAYSNKVRKITVHHTDSELRDLNGDARMDTRDYREMIRSIYYFHARSRGWGDIGYNYIIDPLGNIYEGRYGGPEVVGAHALCYNNGSMGIAVIGNYEDNHVPEPAKNALIGLISQKAQQFKIDTQGKSDMRGKSLNNIYGHKDVRSTACPGKRLQVLLPEIRKRASLLTRFGTFKEQNEEVKEYDYNAQIVDEPELISVDPGGRNTFLLKFKNTGKKAWDDTTWMHVALNKDSGTRIVPIIKEKLFVASHLKEDSVKPGEIGTFEVEMEGGYFEGNASYELAVVANGRFKISRASVFVLLHVNKSRLDYEVVETELPGDTVFQGSDIAAHVKLRNTGNVIWRNFGPHPITLGTERPRDRESRFIEENPSRIGYLVESVVEPGEVGTFVIDLKVPLDKQGAVFEEFAPVIEGVAWLGRNQQLGFRTNIKKPEHKAEITKLASATSMIPGEMKRFEINLKNAGDLTWDLDNMHVALFTTGMRLFKQKIVPLTEMESGESRDFNFFAQAPYKGGTHSVTLRSRFGRASLPGGLVKYNIQVPNPSLRASLEEQSARSLNVNPGSVTELTVKFKNIGNTVWRNKGINAVYLGTTSPKDRESRLYYENDWANPFRPTSMEESTVNPGEIATFKFKIKPENRGVFRESFQLVMEQVGWFDAGIVRFDVRSFGDTVKTKEEKKVTPDGVIDELEDSKNNKSQAALITKAKEVQEKKEEVVNTATIDEQPMRVRLSYNDNESVISTTGVADILDDRGDRMFVMGPGARVKIIRYANNIHVQVGNTTKNSEIVRIVPLKSDNILTIKSWSRPPAWNPKLNDNQFRGALELRVVNNEAAYINELPMEDYLKGIAEVSNSAPFEKQKAMAVLARTYARFYMQDENRKFPGLPYDGNDDPAVFQKYLGYGYEKRSPDFIGAVAITEDEVVTYKGELIKTPYFSQSDGRTRSAQEVWGWTSTPYLQSVDDPFCKGLQMKGHGVGLSGCGAQKAAENGKRYDEIIKYYYQGVEIEEIDFE